MKSYDIIGIDEGRRMMFRADSGNGSFSWKIDLEDYPTARALQDLENGRILAGFDGGFMEIDIADGRILHCCRRWKGITSALRRDDGATLLTGLNLEGKEGVCVVTLDEKDRVNQTASAPGDYVRLLSPAGPNRYLLSTNECITETDLDLNTIRKMGADGFLHAWQSLRMDNSRTLVSAGYGAFMAIFDADGQYSGSFGRKEALPAEIEPFFYASFRIASDDSILVANWQGHGPENGDKGRQLIRFSSRGEYLESRSFPEDVSSLQGLLILE